MACLGRENKNTGKHYYTVTTQYSVLSTQYSSRDLWVLNHKSCVLQNMANFQPRLFSMSLFLVDPTPCINARVELLEVWIDGKAKDG